MPTNYTDQFFVVPFGGFQAPADLAIVDQDDNGSLEPGSGDTINGSPITISNPNVTINIFVFGQGIITYEGAIFVVNGQFLFTPTDGQVLQAGIYDSGFITGPNGPVPVEDLAPPCFTLGTLIDTLSGPRAVQDISVGDLIVTSDHGPQPVRWIGSRVFAVRELSKDKKLRPIRIQAGALGNGLPNTDLVVSQQHRVLVRSKIAERVFGANEVLVAAKKLLDIDGIDIDFDMDEVEYFHILFDQHEIVTSNGAETESLYTGPEALKSVGKAARDEIFTIFPELQDRDYSPQGARPFATGRKLRNLTARHIKNSKPLVMQKPVVSEARERPHLRAL